MQSVFRIPCFLLLAAAASAATGTWLNVLPVGVAPSPLVEVDLASLHQGPLGTEATLRVTRAAPVRRDSDLHYRSFVAVVRFRCADRLLEPIAVSYHAGPRGSGAELAAESDLTGDGISPGLLEPLASGTRGSLLKAACGQARLGGSRSASTGVSRP
jgi:hypothetical protein